MVNIKKKIMALCISSLVLLMAAFQSVYAYSENDSEEEKIPDNRIEYKDVADETEYIENDDFSGIITRSIINGKVQAKVEYTDEMGVFHVIEANDRELIMDGTVLGDVSEYVDVEPTIAVSYNSSDILGSWGAWQTFNVKIKTGGMKTAAIAAAIAVVAPWVSLRVIASVATIVAGKYTYVRMKGKIRYKTSGDYIYYERYTNFYGNGKDKLLSKDFKDSRKKHK